MAMKRYAIFCDGTWNSAAAEHPTNVVKLAQSVDKTGATRTTQVVLYIQGVGTGGGGPLTRWVDKVGGGAFGWGLTENIEEAYRALIFGYSPGDQIFIFGFSRGAYTARSLAGLIRASSILEPRHVAQIPGAIQRYRSDAPETKPNTVESFEYRWKYAPHLHTSDEEADWRRQNGHPVGTRLEISYLGVWDTVGALGLPGHYGFVAELANRKYSFHDTKLSSAVASARHAVAVDERRRTFQPALWDNLPTLNGERPPLDDGPAYRQLWFPGDHGSVGGGGDITGLSDAALVWIAEGAEAKGLEFEGALMADFRSGCDHRVSLRNHSKPSGGLFDRITRIVEKDRDSPAAPEELFDTVMRRWQEPPERLKERVAYRPGPLRGFKDWLDAYKPPDAQG
jgi:uncharacterized protein (DUF2235 family)